MYVTLCPLKWYHSPPLAHALFLFEDTFYTPVRERYVRYFKTSVVKTTQLQLLPF